MAELTVQKAAVVGLKATYTAAGETGDTFANSGRGVLLVKNGGATSVTVTVNSQTPCDQGFDHDVTVDIPAGEDRMIGPFWYKRFNDSAGLVHVSYSAVASVTVAVVEVP